MSTSISLPSPSRNIQHSHTLVCTHTYTHTHTHIHTHTISVCFSLCALPPSSPFFPLSLSLSLSSQYIDSDGSKVSISGAHTGRHLLGFTQDTNTPEESPVSSR